MEPVRDAALPCLIVQRPVLQILICFLNLSERSEGYLACPEQRNVYRLLLLRQQAKDRLINRSPLLQRRLLPRPPLRRISHGETD